MEARTKMCGVKAVLVIFFYLMSVSVYGQYCDGDVPSFNVDLSTDPEMSWTSPLIARNGNCCGTSNPDRCLEFVITLADDALSLNFVISSGAVPPGALFYQVDCGPQIPVGQPICLSGPGPHHLTFCKPGNNANTFTIQSYPAPIIGPDLTLCPEASGFIFAEYYNESSMTWTSVAPGLNGDYNSLLDCLNGCDTVNITASGSLPSMITYEVCGTDIAGCLVDPVCETINVSILPLTTIDIINIDNVSCNGMSDGTAEINADGGTSPHVITWNTDPAQNGSQLINVSAGDYTATITDAEGCIQIVEVNIAEPAPLTLQLAAVPPSCYGGSNGAVSTEVNGGTAPYSYSWSHGPISSNVYNLTSGNYNVTVTDANGCQVFGFLELTDPAVLTATITDPVTVCPGSTITFEVTASGGSGTINYEWEPTGTTTSSIEVVVNENSTYTVTVSDDNECSHDLITSATLITMDPSDLQANANQTVICEDGSVELSGTFNGDPNGVVLSWEHCPTCPTDQPIIESPNTTTVYTLTATNSCGQVISSQVEVQVNESPNLSILISENTICPGEEINFMNGGDNDATWSYMWTFGDGTTSSFQNPSHIYNYQGFFSISLQVTDENGCTSILNNGALVTVHPQAVASFTVSTTQASTLNGLISTQNYSLNSNSFSWNFGDGFMSTQLNPSHIYEESGYYQITLYATNDFSCSDSAFITIYIEPSFELFVPNTFTPDGDNFNNTFFAKGFGISNDDFIFRIFNRWGDLIFESHDMNEGWEGTDKRNLNKAQDGTYTWVVYFKDGNNIRHRREGHVNVLK